jgi:N-acetylneuraminic acid mutarotase
LAQQVLGALAYAHERGFIHRDVKPSNILLEGERVYLADFGITKVLQDSGGAGATIAGPTLTGNALMGTPTYMAPEQALGIAVDRRADIYGFGVVLYEVLTGRVPYTAQTPMQVAFKHVEAHLPPPRQVNPAMPQKIEAVLLKALAREPADRFGTASEFATALEQATNEADPPVLRSGRPGTAGLPRGGEPSGRTPWPGELVAPTASPNGGGQPNGSAVSSAEAAGRGASSAPAFEEELLRRLGRVRNQQVLREQAARAPDQTGHQSGTRAPIAPPPVSTKPAGSASAALDLQSTVLEGQQTRVQGVQGAAAPHPQVRPLPRGRYRRRALPLTVGLGGAGVVGVAAVLFIRSRIQSPATTGPIPNMSTARSSYTLTPLPSGQVLAVGGQVDDKSYVATAERYDPVANRWVPAGRLASPRVWHTATLLRSGQVLVVGGSSGSSYLATVERYDPASDTWTRAGQLASARGQHTATLLPNGQVLVAGGFSGSTQVATAERYDPATDTWTLAAQMADARQQATATLLPSGQVLVAGGASGNSAFLATAERYDPATDTWTRAAQMVSPRVWHTATLLPNGQVLVAGGFYSATGQTAYLATVERYDPATDTWVRAAQMSSPRSAHTATLLPNGQVLVAGGQNEASFLASTEQYDPATDRWTTAADMVGARSQDQAALLPNGQVLVAGGVDRPNSTAATATVERYDPTQGRWIANRSG